MNFVGLGVNNRVFGLVTTYTYLVGAVKYVLTCELWPGGSTFSDVSYKQDQGWGPKKIRQCNMIAMALQVTTPSKS